MTDRVLIGRRSGQNGIYVSRPGVNVLTADLGGLLMSTDELHLQIIQRGYFSSGGGNTSISWSPVGFRPRLIVSTQNVVQYISYTSDNSATINIYGMSSVLATYWNVGSPPGTSNDVFWATINQTV